MANNIPTDSQVARYFLSKSWHERKLLIPELLVLPINVVVNRIVPPIILANVIQRLSQHDYEPHRMWASFGGELVLYAALVIGGGLTWRLIDVFHWQLEGRVEKRIAQQVFSHLLNQSARFHADNFTGSLVSQTNKLMGAYIRFADTTIYSLIPMVLNVIFVLIVLAFVSPLFAIVLLVFSVVYVISSLFVTRPVRRLAAKHATIESMQTGNLADAVTNALAIKSFAGKQFEDRRFAQATKRTQRSLLRFSRAHQKQQFYFSSMLSSVEAIALLVAVISVMSFGTNIATVFLIFTYTATITQELFSFSNSAIRNYNRSLGDSKDMVGILRTPAEVVDPTQPEPSRISKGLIAFEDISFMHDGAKRPIFDHFGIEIHPGEKVGLVGHSGSGKTTFTRLLLRFSDLQSGAITIDGQNIAAITQDDLRRNIAYVPQEPLLFHRSIAENISYGNPDADESAIHRASKLAHAHEFVKDLPRGYDTLVGERGVKLSGGQRQRIAIARAMLKDAPILLLDEATSALDSESEVLIQDALWKLMEGRTTVVIAHRLSTVQHMDRIVVLDDGVIVEQGSHKALLAQHGAYAKLWEHQSGGFIED